MSKNAALKRGNFDITRALSDAPIEAFPNWGGDQSGTAADSERFVVGLAAVVLLQAGTNRGLQPIRSDLSLG